jgi:uncharacterized protein RhaS with RHS repeats
LYNGPKPNAVSQVHHLGYPDPLFATASPNNISHDLQQITYTPFLKTEQITEHGLQNIFTYNQDYDRVKSVLTDASGTVLETKIYLGDYEIKTDASGQEQRLHYIAGGNGLCALVVQDAATEAFALHVIYTDHLGSIVTVTDANGDIEAEQNFDAWGRNRNTTDWSYTSVATNPTWLYRA